MFELYLLDIHQKIIKVIPQDKVIEATEESELNGLIKSYIAFPYELYNDNAMYFGVKTNTDSQLFRIITENKQKSKIQLTGIHIFFDELKGNIIRDKRPTNSTAKQAMDIVLEDTEWTVISTVQGTNSTTFYNISSLEAFYDVLKKWNCEFYPNIPFENGKLKKVIRIEKSISKDYGKWFEHGDRLLTVMSEENHSEIFTGFIGLGKGEQVGDGYGRKIKFTDIEWTTPGNPVNKPLGQDYVEIVNATKLYGYPNGKPRITTVDFSDVEDKNELLEQTYKYALENSRPKLQLKATAISDSKVELGEIATIIRDDLDIRYKTRIYKVKTNLLSGTQEFEFGDKIVTTQAERIRQSEEARKETVREFESRFEEVLNNINLTYFNEDGYTYNLDIDNEFGLPSGIYSFDRPIEESPTKVIYIGAGKVLISNEKGVDGEWIWQTALDGSGLVGSSIVSNSITANELESDIGQNLDISSNESINQIVTNINETTGAVEGLQSRLELTSDSFTQTFTDLTDRVDKNSQDLESITAKIRSGMDEQGEAYTDWLGSNGNIVRVASNGIEMISDNAKTMELKNGSVYADSLYVQRTIGFGNHEARKHGTEYTIFPWVGGNNG